jgi:hypothetical protein
MKRTVWFVDTSALMSAAASADLGAALQARLAPDAVILLDAVVSELDHRARVDGPRSLAAKAKKNLAWLGPPVDTSLPAYLQAAADIQWELAGGREPDSEFDHWAESIAIVMIEGATQRGADLDLRFLSEDYDARITAAGRASACWPMSTHTLLWTLVQGNKMPAQKAADIADELQAARRGQKYLATDFLDSDRYRGLNSVGEP